MDNQVVVTSFQLFNLIVTKDCSVATLTPINSLQSFSYTVNNINTVGLYQMTDFTISDTYCVFTYGLDDSSNTPIS